MIRWRGGNRVDPSRWAEPQHLGGNGDVHRTSADELLDEARQEPLDRPLPGRKDHLEVVAMRYTWTIGGVTRVVVALDDRDPLEVAGQGLGGEQTGHSGANHDGVVAL